MNWKQLMRGKGRVKELTLFNKPDIKEEEKKPVEKKIDDATATNLLDKLLMSQRITVVFGKPDTFEKPITYALTRDGVIEVRKNRIGTFSTKVEKCNTFPDDKIPEGMQLNVPKIPLTLLDQIVGFFKEINKKYKTEAYVQIFFNDEKKEYFIYVPEQEVTGAHVKYEHDNKMHDGNNILVMDIHSHNTMGAFFSGTDDKDETRDQLYGVIGKIEQTEPDMKFRYCSGGKHVDLTKEQIFEVPTRSYEYPQEWNEKIKEKTWTSKTYKGYNRFGDDGEFGGYEAYHNYGYDPTDTERPAWSSAGAKKGDEIDEIIEKHKRKGIHRMTEDEFEAEMGFRCSEPITGLNDDVPGDDFLDPEETVELRLGDVMDELMDLPKSAWSTILAAMLFEDSKTVNAVVNRFNHKRKSKK